ncbi:MAG: glycerophosphodiester phosphodiesterase family protein [Clostridia bacterium]|nr:glycerophosphodiester phosphodiesterase family protein [Clostridia bacterium]
MIVLFAIYLFLVAPSKSGVMKRAPFFNRNYAHRGLFSKDQSVPENSLAAFKRAVETGFGVELDVQFSLDLQLVVFHDDKLKRACGVDARVDSYSYEELQALPLFGTEHRIPLFSDVLEAIGGRIPIIVEIKSRPDYKPLCAEVIAMLSTYEGAFCVESFDPRIVRFIRVHAPTFIRGQLSEPYSGWRKGKSAFFSFAMSRLLTNFHTRPHFIAFGVNGRRNLSWYVNKLMGAMMVCWTVRTEEEMKKQQLGYDAIIFEHIHAEPRFF